MPRVGFGPVDPQFAVFRPALLLAAMAGVAVALVFLVEWRKRRLAPKDQRALALLGPLLLAAGLVAAAWAIRWTGAAAPSSPPFRAAPPLSWVWSFPLLLASSFALFVAVLRRGRWPQAYFALAAGPGLGALLVIAKVAFPTYPATAVPFFEGPMAFPDHAAPLLLALAAVAWLTGLARRRAWIAGVGVAGALAAACITVAWGQSTWAGELAGVGLGLAWLAACWMALALQAALLHPDSLLTRLLGRLDAAMQRAVARPGPWLAGLILLGVALRVASQWWTPLAVDAFSYSVLADSVLHHGTFTMPWGDVDTYATAAVPSHHYPPLFPVYLAGWFAALGTSQSTVHVASIASSLGAMLAVFLCTRDLYGRMQALVATAIVAVSPLLVQNTGQGYSENLVLLLFVVTLWAILKSLERPWFIALAGVLAGLGYLTKSSMGYFFVIAGLGGLAWRLYWKGLRVLKDPAYLLAIAAFGSFLLAWAWRNLRLFGSWETSQHISDAYHTALRHPGAWLVLTTVTFVFYATVAYLLYLGLLPWLPSLARIHPLASEHDSGLWLALGLPLLLTAAIDAALWIVERQFFLNNVRYVSFVVVPLTWLLLRHVRLDTRATRLALLATLLLLLAGSLFFAKPSTAYNQAIADDLAPRLSPGDSVAFVDGNNHFVYRYWFQLTQDGHRQVSVTIACLEDPLCPATAPRVGQVNATWVLTPFYAASQLPPGYTRVATSPAAGDADHPLQQTLWHRGP